jgi:L-amino acid N-acyltransferase YncA
MILVRPAAPADARDMAELLNEIIRIGGTTANTVEVTSNDMADSMATSVNGAWHVATDEAGRLMGFQYVRSNGGLPPEACDIATFVRVGETGLGSGARLFDASRAAAEQFGYDWINANIRADNESGRTYYQSRGFRLWGTKEGVVLDDGTVVDKVLTRYDLKD